MHGENFRHVSVVRPPPCSAFKPVRLYGYSCVASCPHTYIWRYVHTTYLHDTSSGCVCGQMRVWAVDGMAGSSGGGDGRKQFVRHSISFWHNKLWHGNHSYRFQPQINNSDIWGSTQSYTCMVQTGPRSGVVMYGQGTCSPSGPSGPCSLWPMATFAMPFSFS